MPKYKSIDVDMADDGSISGYFSTWTRTPDSYGEVVAKGAFLDSFAEIKANGGTVPFLWNHDYSELDHFIGTAGDFAEDDHGARFRATFDGTPTAQRARQLAADGRLAKFSFAYDTLDSSPVTLDNGVKATELRKLKLYEVSLVMYPANDDTSVLEVKSTKSTDAAVSNLRQATQLIQQALAELGDSSGATQGAGTAAGGGASASEDSGSGNEGSTSEDSSSSNDESGTETSGEGSTEGSGEGSGETTESGTTESGESGTTEGEGTADTTPDGGTSRDALLQRIKSLI